MTTFHSLRIISTVVGSLHLITGKSFSLGDKRYPLKCTNPICKGYISLKDYQDMEVKAYGAFCQSCRSELPGQPRIYSGFELDHKTAIMSSQSLPLGPYRERIKKAAEEANWYETMLSFLKASILWQYPGKNRSLVTLLNKLCCRPTLTYPSQSILRDLRLFKLHLLLLSKPHLPSFVKLPRPKDDL